MDCFAFLNSADVKDHLKEISYRFNTLEAVYLIHQCRHLSMKEKIAAWKEVSETMPDMVPAEVFSHCRWEYYSDSAHAFLVALVDFEEKKDQGLPFTDIELEKGKELEWQLECMWFGIPTPFKRGDIVIDRARPFSGDFWSGPFIIIETATEYFKRKGRSGNDSGDMFASGYFQNAQGDVYEEVMHEYLSLEYCKEEELKGFNKQLIELSKCIKRGDVYE